MPMIAAEPSIDRAVAEIETRVREASAFRLADAQFLIARAHAFESWADFVRHLERLDAERAAGDEFEAAADAVVGGDLDRLRALLATNPGLVRARSSRVHRATLL